MTDPLHILSEYMVESFDRLEFTGATGCRCMSCYAFKLIDLDDKVTFETDTLEDLVAEIGKSSPKRGIE